MTVYLLFLIALFAVAHGAIRKIDTQIVKGRYAKPGEVPYQVSLQRNRIGKHRCGGAIIGQYYILTAAHCVDGVDVSTISAHVGLTDLQEPHAVHLIESSYIHKDYNRTNSWINDIALLKLHFPIKYSPLVSPVKLMLNQTIPVGTDVVASGFGKLSYKGSKTTRLHVVDIKIADQTYCKNVWTNKSNKIYDTQICANDATAEKGSCKGDSGGPLTLNGVLIGLDSWGFKCGDKIYPEVYTRVASYIQWIIDHTTDS
ncbi:chymotrypsin-2-like isoform X3 [Temnothorax americanus]|uniref:chymotrypsin-2-like isoform X3 n=1 Tax=Temnothorax americanus TaxID=1964332 RepID=UPI0040684ADC